MGPELESCVEATRGVLVLDDSLAARLEPDDPDGTVFIPVSALLACNILPQYGKLYSIRLKVNGVSCARVVRVRPLLLLSDSHADTAVLAGTFQLLSNLGLPPPELVEELQLESIHPITDGEEIPTVKEVRLSLVLQYGSPRKLPDWLFTRVKEALEECFADGRLACQGDVVGVRLPGVEFSGGHEFKRKLVDAGHRRGGRRLYFKVGKEDSC